MVSSPAVADGALYIGSYDHAVYAIGSAGNQACTVVFRQSGLPQGTCWSVTFNNQTQVSDSDTVVFGVPMGTFAYGVTPPYGYTVSPSSGTLLLGGPNLYLQVTFTQSAAESPFLAFVLIAVFLAVGIAFAAFFLKIRKKQKS